MPVCHMYAADSHRVSRVQFTFLLAGSMFYDIIWMVNHSQNWFIRTVTIILLVLKVMHPMLARYNISLL